MKISRLTKDFEIIIFDVYGVINFGQGMSPKVLQTMEELIRQRKKVIILSNASFGVSDARKKYAAKGMFENVHYSHVVTSGEFGRNAVQNGKLPVSGTNVCIFSTANFKRPEDKMPDLLKDSIYRLSSLEEADFVYCGIPQINYEDRLEIDDFLPELESIRSRNLPLVCANPDLRANEGGRFVIRQGSICEKYAQMGGKTILYGKPDPQIYDWALSRYPEIPKDKVLMIGDTLRTDILGANRAGIRSCLVIEGGITEYCMQKQGMDITGTNLRKYILREGICPDYICRNAAEEELF